MRFSPLLALLLLAVAACQTPEPVPAPADEAPAPAVVTPEAATAPVNLNTGTADDFRAVMPEISDRMIHEFEEYRPYVSIQQFRREMAKYVDEATIAGYERHVFVPVNPAESDAATIQQIPGIDAAEAEALVAGRPYATPQDFAQAAAGYATIDANAIAAYLNAP